MPLLISGSTARDAASFGAGKLCSAPSDIRAGSSLQLERILMMQLYRGVLIGQVVYSPLDDLYEWGVRV